MKEKNAIGWGVSINGIIFRFKSKEASQSFVDFVKVAWDGYLDDRNEPLDVRLFWLERRAN